MARHIPDGTMRILPVCKLCGCAGCLAVMVGEHWTIRCQNKRNRISAQQPGYVEGERQRTKRFSS